MEAGKWDHVHSQLSEIGIQLSRERERERTMVLSIVVLSMCLRGGGGGGGGGDAGSQTKDRRDKKVGIKSESSLIKCAIREIRTEDL